MIGGLKSHNHIMTERIMIPCHATNHFTRTTSAKAMDSQMTSDTVANTTARSSKWFLTKNDAFASSFYTAVAIRLGLATNHSAQELNLDRYVAAINTHDNIDSYFKNSDVAMVWELAPTTGHYHLHLCVHNKNKLSRRQLMDIFGPCDCRVMVAEPHVAHSYLQKSGNLILYIGNVDYWKAPTTKTSTPVDWRAVMSKAMICDSYNEFMRKYVTCDNYDEDCLKASLNRASWVMSIINCKSDKKVATKFTKTVWQDSCLAIAKQPAEASHRKIVNIWSTESGTGKSTLADLIRNESIPVFVFPSNMKLHDAVYMYNYEKVVIIDLARHASIENSGVYEVLEVISDQRICSTGKYGGKSVRWLAHTFVLSNQPLDQARLPGRIDLINVKPLDQEHMSEIVVSLDFMNVYDE